MSLTTCPNPTHVSITKRSQGEAPIIKIEVLKLIKQSQGFWALKILLQNTSTDYLTHIQIRLPIDIKITNVTKLITKNILLLGC